MQNVQSASKRLIVPLAMAVLLVVLPACSSGGGGGGGTTNPNITGDFVSDDASATDFVRMRVGTVTDNLVDVEIAIGGATAFNDYYAFVFDIIVGDPDVAQLVTNSASAGTFLSGNVTALASLTGVPGRYAVGVSKQGAVGGDGTANAEEVVVTLTFEVTCNDNGGNPPCSTTLSFAGSPNPPAGLPPGTDETGLDSSLAVVPNPPHDFGTGGTISGS